MNRAGVLTLSDKGSKGQREDRSGEILKRMLSDLGLTIDRYEIIPDEEELIRDMLIKWTDELCLDLIVTTGGTGLSPRDVTPEATLSEIGRAHV